MERIYIVQGSGGLFKVGRTTNFRRRLSDLRGEFAKRGDTVKRFHAFPEIAESVHAEARFIEWATLTSTEFAGGNEWFRGLDFDAAIVAGESITAAHAGHPKVTLAEKRARIQRHTEQRKAIRAQDAQAMARCAERRAHVNTGV